MSSFLYSFVFHWEEEKEGVWDVIPGPILNLVPACLFLVFHI